MSGATVEGLLMVALLIGAGAGYLFGSGSVKTVTSVSTASQSFTTTYSLYTTSVTTTWATATTPSLELIVGVWPASIASGQNVTITAEVYNPLSVEVVSNSTMINNPTQAPCGLGIIPTGIQVYNGHYTFTNISQGMPLMLYNASGPPPPCFVQYSSVYHFSPNSDKAVVFYLGTSVDWTANETLALRGYWVQVASNGLPRFVPQEFTVGEYTALVFDSWGQQQLEYFKVTQ